MQRSTPLSTQFGPGRNHAGREKAATVSQDDQTVLQSEEEKRRRRRESVENQPPEVPGYELTRLLGQGAFGQVWGGVQVRTGQKVAIKVLKEAGGSSWGYFRHELERLRDVAEHPGIVTLIDADLIASPPYFVMPWLGRGSLANAPVPASPAQAVDWFGQMAAALQFTHEKGILHCDLKPSNVLVDGEGRLRLVDFGQARLHGERGAFGTFGYMAPEQASEGASSPSLRWDIYSLGATIYCLLTGRCPRVSAEDLNSLRSLSDTPERLNSYRQALQQRPLVPVRELNPQVDSDLNALVESCLALDPARRPASAAEILQDLQRRAQGEPLLCRRPWTLGYRLGRVARRPLVQVTMVMSVLLVTVLVSAYQRSLRDNRNLQEQQRQIQREKQALQLQLCDMQSERGTTAAASDPQQALLWWSAALAGLPLDGPGVPERARNLRVRLRYHLFHRLLWKQHQSQRSLGCFSPDGRWLLNARPGQGPELLDAATGQVSARLDGTLVDRLEAGSLAFAPDSKSCAVWMPGGRVGIFGLDGSLSRQISVSGPVLGLRFSGAGELQVLTGDGLFLPAGVRLAESQAGGLWGDRAWTLDASRQLRIWRLSSGSPVGRPQACAVDPSLAAGKIAVATGSGAQVFELENGRAAVPDLLHPDKVLSVCLSPDGRTLATTCADRNLRLWDLPAGILRVTRPYTTDCLALAFRPDSRMLAQSCADGKTRLWDVASGTLAELWRNAGGASEIHFSPFQDKILLLGPTGGMWLRERVPLPMRELPAPLPVTCLAFGPDRQLLAGGPKGLQRWDGRAWRPLSQEPVADLRFAPGAGRLWAGQVVLEGERVVARADAPWLAADFAGDKLLVATQSARFLEEVDLSGGPGRSFPQLGTPAIWCRYQPATGQPAAAANDLGTGFVTLFEGPNLSLSSGEQVLRFEFEPEGRRLAAGGQAGGLYLWDAKTRQELNRFRFTQAVSALIYDLPGRKLAAASLDGTARVFQAESLRPQFNELAHFRRLPVRTLAFSPDGLWLASGCDDGTARIWDARTGLLVTCWLPHDGPVTALAFSPDGRELASASRGGPIRFWDLAVEHPPGDLSAATGMRLDAQTGSVEILP